MPADGSMAVWCEHKSNAAGAAAEVHFNYWRIAGDAAFVRSSKGTAKDFIEIGVLLSQAPHVEKVNIYLPGQPSIWRIEDCGPYFKEPYIAQAIFSERLSSNTAEGPQRVDLLRPNQSHFCRVHIFPTDDATISPDQLVRTSVASGTLLTIARHALDEACYKLPSETPVYFRLRAYHSGTGDMSPFVKRIKPKDRFLHTGHSVVDYLDFRLNEARSLPSQIETLMRSGSGSRVPHKLSAFLTAVPVQSDVTTISWEKLHKKRLLEDDLWMSYVPSGIPRGMIVFHWREVATAERPSIEDFSGFVKMQTRLVSWPVLLISIAIAFILAVLGNLVASWIWDKMHPPLRALEATPGGVHSTNAPAPTLPKQDSAKPNPRQK
jgi:hypothetical protein